MSYTQKFRGSMRFADAHCLEAGLDALAAEHESVVEVDDLKFEDGFLVRVDNDGSAPASMWDPTIAALWQFASFAGTGYISCEFHLDGIGYERIFPGERTSSEGLPPQHHRWDVMLAAQRGDADQLRDLVQRGVDLGITFGRWAVDSPLHLAAKSGSVAAVEVLLAAGIAVDHATSEHGPTPLAVAKTADVARRLIAAGADVDRGAPIVHAAEYGRDDVVLALIAAGSKIPEASHARVVHACCRHAKLEALLALIAHEPALVPHLAAPDAMKAAVSGGEPVVVDLLLSHGNALPETFLADTIDAKATALLEMALRAPDALARCGDSSHRGDAMVRAAEHSSVEVMELLARHGVPVHPAVPGETSPVHAALYSFRGDVAPRVDWLFAHGAPRDAVTAEGKTLMQSAWSEMKAHLVIAHGFDPATIDREDMAAEDVIQLDKLLNAAAKKKAAEEAKVAAAKRKEERAAAKVQKEAEKAQKAEAAAAAKAQKEADKAAKAAEKARKAEAAAAAKAQKEADRAAKAAAKKPRKVPDDAAVE